MSYEHKGTVEPLLHQRRVSNLTSGLVHYQETSPTLWHALM